LDQGDTNDDGNLSKAEFAAVAETWFAKLDADKSGKLTREQFSAALSDVLPPPRFGPPGFGPPGGAPGQRPQFAGGRGGFGPARFLGPVLFAATDTDKDGTLTRAEFEATFAKWFADWDSTKSGALSEENLRAGLNAALPRPNFGGPGGARGPGGPG